MQLEYNVAWTVSVMLWQWVYMFIWPCIVVYDARDSNFSTDSMSDMCFIVTNVLHKILLRLIRH